MYFAFACWICGQNQKVNLKVHAFKSLEYVRVFSCFWKKSLILTKAAFIVIKDTLKTVILWNIINI